MQKFNARFVDIAAHVNEAGTDRIVEDLRATIQRLMDRTHYRGSLGGHTRTFFFHFAALAPTAQVTVAALSQKYLLLDAYALLGGTVRASGSRQVD
jgi:hypothetical protein